MENLKGKRIFVKHNYMCPNVKTVGPKHCSPVMECSPPPPTKLLLFFRGNIYLQFTLP